MNSKEIEKQWQHQYAEEMTDDEGALTIYALGGFVVSIESDVQALINNGGLLRRGMTKAELGNFQVVARLENEYRMSLLVKMNSFLSVLQVTNCFVKKACNLSGLTRSQAEELRVKIPEFNRIWTEAYEDASDELENAAFTRAVHGVDEDVFWRGDVVGTKTVYSDSLLSMMLQGRKSDKYKQKISTEHTGDKNNPVAVVDITHDLDTIRAELERRGLPTSIFEKP